MGVALTLPLLESRVLLVDHETLAASDDDLAIFRASSDAALNFHDSSFARPLVQGLSVGR